MTTLPPGSHDHDHADPDVSPADQAAFFARLEAELNASEAEPEPEWKARTIGHFVLNPQAYRLAVASCIATLAIAAGVIGWSVHRANRPLDNLHLPPGYQLISTPDGRLIAVSDQCAGTPKEEALRAAALRELQMLLSEPSRQYAADGLAVTASSNQ